MTVFIVDDLSFDLQRSTRRRTLEITVDRGGELLLKAPSDTDEQVLRDFVVEKRGWVYQKLAEKELLHRSIPRKQFVDGEGFPYLGRTYRLKLTHDQVEPVKLIDGRLRLRKDLAAKGAHWLIRWYSERGREWLEKKAAEHAPRMEVNPAGVKVQDLGYRWGSCGKGQWLYFHWKTILLPRTIAEYVVVHELAHLQVPHHTPDFWRRVERVLPDYERRKTWLAEHGMEVEGI